MKMTPGPWLRDNLTVYALDQGVNKFSARVDSYGTRINLDEAEANAKAIAAVPELIAALEYVLAIENFHALETVRYGEQSIKQIVEEALKRAGVL